MARVLGQSVLFYLVDQSFTYVNSGNSTAAGVIKVNGTSVVISNSNVPAIIQVAINASLGGAGSAGIIASIANAISGSIASIGDAGGGDITVTDVDHGLAANDVIVISGCTDPAYNGTFTVLAIPTTDTFTVTASYTASDTGTWTRGLGTVTVTDVAHGLSVGDSIIISGCSDSEYNGTFTILTVSTADTFTITATWGATDIGYWESAYAGFVTVSLETETITVLFNYESFNEMTVTIDGTAVTVTDATSLTADNLIAEQTNLEISYDIELDDVTSKDDLGKNTVEPVELSLSVSNSNIYTSSDANYQMLRRACDSRTPIYAYIVKASGIPIACSAVIDKLEEPVETKKVVRANCSWKSTGAITRIT